MTTDAEITARLARVSSRLADERTAKRAAARQYLPELDRHFDQLWRTFRARVEYLETPAGTWGRDETATWPSVKLSEMHPLPEALETRAKQSTRRGRK